MSAFNFLPTIFGFSHQGLSKHMSCGRARGKIFEYPGATFWYPCLCTPLDCSVHHLAQECDKCLFARVKWWTIYNSSCWTAMFSQTCVCLPGEGERVGILGE